MHRGLRLQPDAGPNDPERHAKQARKPKKANLLPPEN